MTVIRRLTDGLWRELRYALWLTVHPFKGFWEIKKEGRGSGRTATLFLLCYLLVTALSGLYTGYLFREEDVLDFSAPKAMLQVLLLFFGFCVANWGLTCLFDGEGTFADIYRMTAYALLPLLLIRTLLLPLSNYFLLTEQSFYTTLYGAALLWSGFLLLVGTLVTHQYSLGKTVVMLLCIVAAMCMLAYIALLYLDLVWQVIGFITTLLREASMRR